MRKRWKWKTYKMFWSSFEDVDLFACICLSACLPEYLYLSSVSDIYTFLKSQISPLHFVSSLIVDQLVHPVSSVYRKVDNAQVWISYTTNLFRKQRILSSDLGHAAQTCCPFCDSCWIDNRLFLLLRRRCP